MELNFIIIDEADITEELDRAIRDGLVACYPDEHDHFTRQRWWHSHLSWTVCALEQSGKVAGHLSIVERCVSVGEKARMIKVAGVQNVFVQTPWRKTGLSDRVMMLALDEARQRNLDAGLLFCLPVLEKVYNRTGWVKIDAAVFMHNESGACVPLPAKNIAMVVPLLVEEFPAGDINLMGRDW